jgi:hypothetical protein
VPDYHPQPIDTAEVELAGLLPLAEILGRNLHEVWALFRVKEGWTYGPTRDDARKLHPCLLPFDELPAADQAHDRAVMTEILKAAIALRFRILAEEHAAKADDMNDDAEIAELKKHPAANRLLRVLTCCRNIIEPEFRRADTEVGIRKKVYMRFALCAAWLGAAALFFAILQLSELGKTSFVAPLLPWVEFGLAAAAVGVAIVGLAGRKQEKWFLARFRAERLRLLKYDFLTRAALWSENSEDAERCCQNLWAEVEEAKVSSFSTLEYWENLGTLPTVVAAPDLPEEEWVHLQQYYWKKRLLSQIDYLAGAIERNWQRNDKTRTWPSVLFFGSIAFVLAHFCVDLAGKLSGMDPDAPVGRIVLLLAATLPVCGAGIRAIRGVLEYGRNASRYEANHNVLVRLSERLRAASDPAGVFREIGFCEQILESDLREWLRLMVEAEWFG